MFTDCSLRYQRSGLSPNLLKATAKRLSGGWEGLINYNNANGDAAIVINKANAVCAVSGYDVVYDYADHVATGTCTGVNGAPLGGLNLTSTTHKEAGDYTDTWTVAGGLTYHDASGTVADKVK